MQNLYLQFSSTDSTGKRRAESKPVRDHSTAIDLQCNAHPVAAIRRLTPRLAPIPSKDDVGPFQTHPQRRSMRTRARLLLASLTCLLMLVHLQRQARLVFDSAPQPCVGFPLGMICNSSVNNFLTRFLWLQSSSTQPDFYRSLKMLRQPSLSSYGPSLYCRGRSEPPSRM